MRWDKDKLKEVVEPVPGKNLAETDPKKNLVHAYKKHLNSLTENAAIDLNRLYLKVFWERYPTPQAALDAPADVLYEALYAMHTGTTDKTAQKNSDLLHLLKQQAQEDSEHKDWVHYLYLSELIISNKNLQSDSDPKTGDSQFSSKIRIVYDKNMLAAQKAEAKRVAELKKEKQQAKEQRIKDAIQKEEQKKAEKKAIQKTKKIEKAQAKQQEELKKQEEEKLRQEQLVQEQEKQVQLEQEKHEREEQEKLQREKQQQEQLEQEKQKQEKLEQKDKQILKTSPKPKQETTRQIIAQQKTIVQPSLWAARLKDIEYLSTNLFYLACFSATVEYTLEQTTSLSQRQCMIATGGLACAIPATLIAYLTYKERIPLNAFQAAKKEFESDSSWHLEQFTTLVQAYRKVKNYSPELLTGENKKIIFLKQILHIYQVLNKYTHYDFLQYNGREILRAIEHFYKYIPQDDSEPDELEALEKAANDTEIFLTGSFSEPENEDLARYVRLNNFFVNGKGPLTAKEQTFAESFIKEIGSISQSGQISFVYIKGCQFALNNKVKPEQEASQKKRLKK